MVQRFRKHIAVLLACCIAFLHFPGVSFAEEHGDFTYSVVGEEVTITGYTGSGGGSVIPDTIENKPVTAIGANAFQDQTAVTSILIPETVGTIGDGAFAGCTNLEMVYFTGDMPIFGTENVFSGVHSFFRAWHHLTKTTWDGYSLSNKQPYVTQTLKFQDGSTPDSVSMAAVTDGKLSRPSDPVRSGYTFMGWYDTEAYAGGAWDFAADTVHGDITLHAKWTQLPAAPQSVKAVSASYNSIRISWGAVAGASGYKVYRKNTNGTFSLINETTGTNYTNTGRITGKTYSYKVQAYRIVGENKVYGGYSAIVSAKALPAAPQSVKAVSASYNSIRISWRAVAGASGYKVYRKNTNGTFSLINETTGTNYTNTGRITGKTYSYKVRAYRIVGEEKVYGGYSAIVSAKAVPGAPSSVQAAAYGYTGIKVSWGAVSGAYAYTVYRASSATGSYTAVTATKKTTYTDNFLKTGKTYYYKIRAYQVWEGAKAYGSYSKASYSKPGTADIYDRLIETAKGELGYEEVKANPADADGWTKYAVDYPIWKYGAWCACFVTWCAKQGGLLHTVIPKYAWVLSGKAWYKERGLFRDAKSGYVPKKGDVIFFHEPDSPVNANNHTGFVEAYDPAAKKIYTIEGNIHDSVDRDIYGRNDAYVTGFGVNGGTSLGQIPVIVPLEAGAVSASPTSIRVSWTDTYSSYTYVVYRAASLGGTYTYLASTASGDYTDEGLTTGKTYYYKVRAYKVVDGNRIYSVYTQPLEAKPS